MATKCVSCKKAEAKFRESADPKRVFCSQICQNRLYIGLKDSDLGIDDDDLVGLESSDGATFTITKKQAAKLALLNMPEDGDLVAGTDNYYRLPNVDSETLTLIIALLNSSEKMDDIFATVEAWYATQSFTSDHYFKVLLAADYLGYTELENELLKSLEIRLASESDPHIWFNKIATIFIVGNPERSYKSLRAAVAGDNIELLKLLHKSVQYPVFSAVYNEFIDQEEMNLRILEDVVHDNQRRMVEYMLLPRHVYDPQQKNNIFGTAIRHSTPKILKLLLDDTTHDFDPGAFNNEALITAVKLPENQNDVIDKVLLLIADKRVDRFANNSAAVLAASKAGNETILMEMLHGTLVDVVRDQSVMFVALHTPEFEKILLLFDGQDIPLPALLGRPSAFLPYLSSSASDTMQNIYKNSKRRNAPVPPPGTRYNFRDF